MVSEKKIRIITLTMKRRIYQTVSIIILGFLTLNVSAQKGVDDGSQFGKGEDSIRCLMNLSLYFEFYKHNNYKDAIGPWRIVFNECPLARESMYAYGINMYKAFMEREKDPVKIAAYCDTIMLIHDQRIKYFGDEGNVLGRKGVDLLRYRREEDIKYVKEGYECLKRSVEIEKANSSPVVLTTLISAGITLAHRSEITQEQIINDYITASDIIDQQLRRRADTRTKTAKEAIDSNMKESGILSCENIVNIFGSQFEANKTNKEFLEKIIDFLSTSQCENEQLFADASEKLYEIEPSAAAAYNLARLFFRKFDYENAKKYYLEAIENTTNTEDKARYNYEMAVLAYQYLKQNSSAVFYANEAIKLDPNWGEPYILIGQAYFSGKNEFSDQFDQQTVYWVIVDMFQKAASVDSSVKDKTSGMISEYSAHFPSLEDLFFRSIREGDQYTVKGWINRSTVARARK